jgi:hypothetical protein
MAENKTTQLVAGTKGALGKLGEVPDFLKSDFGKNTGMERVEQSDILLPRLSVCQALSPQKRKSHSAYIEGLQEGQLFNTVTQEIYGEEVEIIPLFFFKNRIKFNPIDEGGGIDCQSQNGIDGGRLCHNCMSCQYQLWGNGASANSETANDPPKCTMYHNFMSFIPSEMIPVAVTYKATGLKLSKQLLAQQRLSRLPMYARVYAVKVVTMKDGDNEWYEKKIVPLRYVDQEMYKEMERNFQALKDMSIHVDTTGESEDSSFNEGYNQASSPEM